MVARRSNGLFDTRKRPCVDIFSEKQYTNSQQKREYRFVDAVQPSAAGPFGPGSGEKEGGLFVSLRDRHCEREDAPRRSGPLGRKSAIAEQSVRRQAAYVGRTAPERKPGDLHGGEPADSGRILRGADKRALAGRFREGRLAFFCRLLPPHCPHN